MSDKGLHHLAIVQHVAGGLDFLLSRPVVTASVIAASAGITPRVAEPD